MESTASWALYETRLGRYRFTTRVVDGELVEMSRGEERDRPDAVIDSDPDTMARVLGDRAALDEAVEYGRLSITGDERAARRLFAAVRL